jgi:hypothetical protein
MLRAVVIAIALLGCRDREIEDLRALRGELCKCKTVECGEALMEKLPQHGTTDHRARAIAKEMLDCMARLYDRNRPSTDPDDEAPTSPGTAAPASAGTP